MNISVTEIFENPADTPTSTFKKTTKSSTAALKILKIEILK